MLQFGSCTEMTRLESFERFKIKRTNKKLKKQNKTKLEVQPPYSPLSIEQPAILSILV